MAEDRWEHPRDGNALAGPRQAPPWPPGITREQRLELALKMAAITIASVWPKDARTVAGSERIGAWLESTQLWEAVDCEVFDVIVEALEVR